MAKPLQTASVAAPGFYGLNTQESSITLAAGFALQADNCVIDKYGRLGARKGWQYLTTGNDGVNLTGAHEFIDINGTRYLGCWSGNSFYIASGSTLTPVTYVGSNVITEDGWQAATLNDAAFLFNSSYEPIYFSPITGQLDDIVNVGHGPVPKGNTVLSAYGRLWTANTATNKTTVYWSNLLDGKNWQTGTAGSLDISSILVNGNDEIVALGAQAGRLIVFCKNNVIIFSDTDADKVLNPANMKLVEVINGVGCIARDSVQNTGTDILFLAKDGLRSLGRLIQEKSQPMRDLSKNVRDDLVRDVYGTDPTEIKSVYSASEAFYLLLLPEYKRIYCFDMRSMLQDGSARATIWDNQTHINMIEANDTLYFTNTDGLARYFGYDDNGASYVIKYYTNYFDFGDSTKQKYLKRLSTTLVGGSGQDFVLKVGYDYDDSYRSFPVKVFTQTNAEYGVAEFGGFNDLASEVSISDYYITETTAYNGNTFVVHDTATGKYWDLDGLATVTDVGGYGVSLTLYRNLQGNIVDLSTTDQGTFWVPITVYFKILPEFYTNGNFTLASNTAEYTIGTLSDTVRAPIGGSGGVLQVGFEATINGAQLSIQKLDIYIKEGRVY